MLRAPSTSPDVDYNLKAMKLEQMISNPDKVFWPDAGYTKLDIARFCANVLPKLKPYVADRLLTMERYPDGMRRNVILSGI